MPQAKPIQLTILWEIDLGAVVSFTATIRSIAGRRLLVTDGTADAFVELAADDHFFQVGDLVAVVGRRLQAVNGVYTVAAERCQLLRRQGYSAHFGYLN